MVNFGIARSLFLKLILGQFLKRGTLRYCHDVGVDDDLNTNLQRMLDTV